MATAEAEVKTLADVKAASEKQAETTESSSVEKAEHAASSESSEKSVDYEAELTRYRERADREKRLREMERERRRQAEKALRHQTQEVLRGGSSSDEEEHSSPDVEALVDERMEALRREQAADIFDDVLSELSDNPKEQELIRAIYESDIRPTGFSKKAIQEDLHKAFLLANRSRFEEIATRKAEAKAKKTLAETKARTESSVRGSIGRNPPEGGSASYTSAETKWLSRVGKTKVDGD